MISVLIANAKGGCGKTTIATNLASAYASRGFETWLIDADRQKSALTWAKRRSRDLPLIKAMRWSDKIDLPAGAGIRIVIDAPAGIRTKAFATLLRECDLAIVPMLASGFDIAATAKMLESIEELKPVRKGRKPVEIIINRHRSSTRASGMIDTWLAASSRSPLARISDRAIYPEMAGTGEGIFDRRGSRLNAAMREWTPVIRHIESLGEAGQPG